MKKILALLLGVLILTSAVVLPGCKKEEEGEAAATTVQLQEGETQITFPERNYEGAEYRVLCTTQCEPYYVTPEDTGSRINEAVFNRNLAVESQYGVVLTFKAMEGRSGGRDAFANEIRISSQGDMGYDLIIGQTYYTMALALEGMYYNMMNSEYLNLDQPWYDKELINDTINIGGKLYAASGSYVISQLTTAMGLYFNKTLYADNQLGDIVQGKDIYQVVRDREWTYEIMYQMTTAVFEENDGKEGATAGDIYGFVGNTHAPACAMVGSDTPITYKDTDGTLSISSYYDSHLVEVFETYFEFFNNTAQNVFYVASDEALIEFFANGQSLFCCNAIEYLGQGVVRDSGIDYGILPFPMFDMAQEDYYTNNIRWEVAHIPATADLEKACIVFEYLNYTSYNEVIPAYFDLVLSTQAVQVPEDAEMLALIRDTVRFDFTTFYQSQVGNGWNDNIYIGVKSLIRNGNSGIASWWDSNKKLFETTFNDLIDTYLYYLEA